MQLMDHICTNEAGIAAGTKEYHGQSSVSDMVKAPTYTELTHKCKVDSPKGKRSARSRTSEPKTVISAKGWMSS